jgi:hypothetical protein
MELAQQQALEREAALKDQIDKLQQQLASVMMTVS